MISVIIPVYNAERFVEKAVKSVLIQDKVKEVILVEDGSIDESLKICRRLTKENPDLLKLFIHPNGENRGAGASRNLGILKANGAYVAFLDADDYYLPGRFENDINILESNLSVDGVYNALGAHIYDESENDRGRSAELTTVKYPIPSERLLEEMAPIGRSGYFSGDALTVRAAIFQRVGYFNEDLELSQDTHMWLKMAAVASLEPGHIERPVAIRGIHSGNRIKNKEKLRFFRPLLFASLLRWANRNNVPLDRKRIFWQQLYLFEKASFLKGNRSHLHNKILHAKLLIRHFLRNPLFRLK